MDKIKIKFVFHLNVLTATTFPVKKHRRTKRIGFLTFAIVKTDETKNKVALNTIYT